MKVLLFIITILAGCTSIRAQEQNQNNPEVNPFSSDQLNEKTSLDKTPALKKKQKPEESETDRPVAADEKFAFDIESKLSVSKIIQPKPFLQLIPKSELRKPLKEDEKSPADLPIEPFELPQPSDFGKFNVPVKQEKFHWKPAINQSLIFLGIQHGMRMIQRKTVRELDGPFFRDWGISVKNLGGWRDGDGFITNYIAHPMQGAVTSRIFINNSDRSKIQEFGKSKEYWESRFKAMAWSAVWSTQFEIGPISEASIGNVGLYDRTGPNLMGWVDIVITPIAGTGVIIAEDMIDKYILKKWLEKKLTSRTRMKIYRTFFTPFLSFSNIIAGKKPWQRDNR